MYHKTYEDASAEARSTMRQTRRAVGIERWSSPLTPSVKFRTFPLPRRENRAGYELRCEAIEVE